MLRTRLGRYESPMNQPPLPTSPPFPPPSSPRKRARRQQSQMTMTPAATGRRRPTRGCHVSPRTRTPCTVATCTSGTRTARADLCTLRGTSAPCAGSRSRGTTGETCRSKQGRGFAPDIEQASCKPCGWVPAAGNRDEEGGVERGWRWVS